MGGSARAESKRKLAILKYRRACYHDHLTLRAQIMCWLKRIVKYHG
jgi:hypothetical protein